MRNSDFQIISPQVVERLGVASDVSLVPHIFEMHQLASVIVGRSLRNTACRLGERRYQEQCDRGH
jgi:hypothetical protein